MLKNYINTFIKKLIKQIIYKYNILGSLLTKFNEYLKVSI